MTKNFMRILLVVLLAALLSQGLVIAAVAEESKPVIGISWSYAGQEEEYVEYYDCVIEAAGGVPVHLPQITSSAVTYGDDGMIVANKCLLRPEDSERFIREAKVLRKFHDDRLVSFVEYFKTVRGATETFFIVMQFLEGMPGFSLRDRINGVKAGGRIPPREIAEAFRRFAEGLQLLH